MTGRMVAETLHDAPLVSVIMPAWNAAHTLDAALQSLLSQSAALNAPLPEFEIVVADDGSTDGTKDILDKWTQPCMAGNRLRCLHLPHAGIAPALNACLNASRGLFIARMDADDIAHPERIALQARHLSSNPSLDVSASCVAFGGDKILAHGFAHFVDWQNSLITHDQIARARFRDTPVCHPSVMFRRKAVDRWGAYRDGSFPEDWEIWLRWLDGGAVMEKLPQPLLVWNDRPARATRSDVRYAREACDRLRAVWLARYLERCNPFHPHVWVVGGGRVARQRLAPLWRMGPEPRAYIDVDPKKIGNRVGGIPVMGRTALPGPGRCLVLNALTSHGAAEEAAVWLLETGYGEKDWLLV